MSNIEAPPPPAGTAVEVRQRVALWPERWPAIALQECIDIVNAAPPEERTVVRYNLPCDECEKQSACLNAKRKTMGPLIYDREMMTTPRSSESSMFPRDLFEPDFLRDEEFLRWYQKPIGQEDRFAVASAWDLAWSERSGGDYLVKMTALLDRQTGKRKLIDILRVQKLSFAQQVELIQSEHSKYHDDAVAIESDAAQMVWAQYIGQTTSVPVMRHESGGQDGGKRNLQTGVPSLIMQLEAHRWEWPNKRGTFHNDNFEVFLSEAEAFGWVDGKLEGVGEHDDTVMAWYHLQWVMNLLDVTKTMPRRRHRGNQQGRYI